MGASLYGHETAGKDHFRMIGAGQRMGHRDRGHRHGAGLICQDGVPPRAYRQQPGHDHQREEQGQPEPSAGASSFGPAGRARDLRAIRADLRQGFPCGL